jgi:hypothetical protein
MYEKRIGTQGFAIRAGEEGESFERLGAMCGFLRITVQCTRHSTAESEEETRRDPFATPSSNLPWRGSREEA